jgi:c(7)-type cytochrome triheme protein
MMRLPRVKITFWRLVLLAVLAVGTYATFIRFYKGLGAASALSDQFPWGLWIGFDVMCGVALAAGGFTVAAAVYVLRLKRFEPILRPTVLTAFLGYLLVGVSLMYDLGRPYRIWHPTIFWNEHSVMFEVAWCVMLYLTVLALEFSPVVFEKLRFHKAAKFVHHLTPLIVIVGVLLSTLHQSSLGTLFVIAPNKLHGLWYTPFLPVLFWNSAIAVGLAMTIVESNLSHRAFGVSIHKDILASLGKAIVVVLGVYLAMKVGTLAARGSLPLIFERSTESYLFILEIILGVLLPMALFSSKRIRSSNQGLFYTAVLVMLGVVLNRLNVGITGIERYAGNVYFPTFLEAASSMFLLALGLLAFALIVRYFPVFESSDKIPHPQALESVNTSALPPRIRMVGPQGAFVLVTLVIVFGGVALWSRFYDKDAQVRTTQEQIIATGRRRLAFAEPPNLNLPPDYTFPKAGNSPGPVVFSHTRHVRWNANACTNCHPKPYAMSSIDIPTIECEYGKMSGCGHCHDGSASFDIQHGCKLCHSRANQEVQAAATDEQLPWRLADVQMAVYDRSFGPVFFSHNTHVKVKKLSCNDCHPKTYKMKKTERNSPGMDSRDAFIEWGHRCKSCHNGMRAFAQADNCAKCHTRWNRDTVAAETKPGPARP